jgi:membrane-associated protease RseP (regulator of RpoE activity)
MLKFQLFGFPVHIHWFFWVNCALLGGAIGADSPREMQAIMGFMLVAFLSVLIHELGHALTMRHYGDQRVGVVLYALGGIAQGSRHLTRSEDFYVSAAGPFVQIVAGVAAWWLKDLWLPEHWLASYMLNQFIWISIFWAVLNLLPIIPLDGGHITLAVLGPQRQKMALCISIICAIAVGILALTSGYIISVLFCGMLAFNNWKQLQGQPQVPWMAAR